MEFAYLDLVEARTQARARVLRGTLAGGEAPSTSGMQDVVKNPTDAEEQAEESGVEGVLEDVQQQDDPP